MLWGGLRPIPSQLVIDSLTLLGLTYAAFTSPHKTKSSLILLITTCLFLLATSGLTNRWTLTLPLVPFVFLQALRRLQWVENSRWASRIITAVSLLLILSGAVLSVLFPAVELPPLDGPYQVGLIDLYLPIGGGGGDSVSGNETCLAHATELPVRLLYPTLESPTGVPMLNVENALDFCRVSMAFNAPPPLRKYDWMLHTWRLTNLRAKRNAELVPGTEKFPLVVYSHGLGGSAEIYAYQTMSLAAHGNIVLQLNHLDGSAPVVRFSNGTTMEFDRSIVQLWMQGKFVEYARERRARTDRRVQELIAATEAVHKLDQIDLPALGGFSLRNRLDFLKTVFMGHSFGGATALTAAKRRPDLVKTIVAHEPAVDWMPDDARRSLFPEERLKGLKHNFTGGTGGFGNTTTDVSNTSLHDINMLVLFSHEWKEKKWGGSETLLSMHAANRFGTAGGISSVGVVESAHHNEFSDTCMLTPVWLARAIGATGSRNPLETAKEIHQRTKAFLDAARS